MSKRNTDGDVLTNRLNLGLAKHQKLLASWAGMQPESTPPSKPLQDEQDDEDLKQESFGHDRLGVGGILPKDIADGTFTKRAPTSNDKLLEQLIGKKRARAHLAAQQQVSRSSVQQQKQQPGKVKLKVRDESEDEDEGRAAAFRPKKQKLKKAPVPIAMDEGSDDSEGQGRRNAVDVEGTELEVAPATKKENGDEGERAVSTKAMPSRSKKKTTSFLDELLAERSSKKKKKKN